MNFLGHTTGGPQGFWGSGENCYLFSGSWRALVIILGELGSKLIILGIQGALPKSKNNKEKPPFCLIFLKKSSASGGLAVDLHTLGRPQIAPAHTIFCQNFPGEHASGPP